MSFDVIGLGELLIDFTPCGKNEHGAPRYEANPGGAPSNALVAIARQGGKAAFIGKIGQDYFGTFLRKTLQTEGIDTQGLIVDEQHPTTLAIVSLDDAGERSFGFYRNASADIMLRADEINPKLIQMASLFHFGSLSLTNEPARSATFHALQIAKEQGLFISYDPNLRLALWNNKEEAKTHLLSGLPFADVLKIGKDEFAFLFDTEDYTRKSAEIMKKYNITYLFVTDGPRGAYYRHGDHEGTLPAYDVSVVDTTGAGDAFTGTVIYHLSQLGRDEFHNLPEVHLREIVKRANASGALSTMQHGGIPSIPTAAEIDECLMSRGLQKEK